MTIQEYQKDCFKNYKTEIGYDPKYKYLYGNPINVLVPIETETNKFMVVGAYPSAKFFTVNKILDTPLYDNDSPFSNESYFDGTRKRTIPSGKELNEEILTKIGINRNECWITDLVKVFLFKEGHIERYKKLGKNDFEENRSKFDEYAKKSISWLRREIILAEPKLIVLLGIEVIQNIFSITKTESKKLMNGETIIKKVDNIERNFVCIPHPGILMKKFDGNPWPSKFENEIAPRINVNVLKIRGTF
ncbi:MAG: uracil-DNA glycosylase family protein [Melioribacteraceae bacterium]